MRYLLPLLFFMSGCCYQHTQTGGEDNSSKEVLSSDSDLIDKIKPKLPIEVRQK